MLGPRCYIGPLTTSIARFIAERTAGSLVGDQLTVDFGSGRTHSLTVGNVHAWRRQDVKLKPKSGARAKRGKRGAAAPALTSDTATATLRPGWFPSSAPSFSTGHWVGFLPVCASEPEKHFLEAMDPVTRVVKVLGPTGATKAVSFDAELFASGRTVELVGPKVERMTSTSFWNRFPRMYPLYTTPRALWAVCALRSAHACWMLIDACNPMS